MVVNTLGSFVNDSIPPAFDVTRPQEEKIFGEFRRGQAPFSLSGRSTRIRLTIQCTWRDHLKSQTEMLGAWER
jgi:hypothetical protein